MLGVVDAVAPLRPLARPERLECASKGLLVVAAVVVFVNLTMLVH